MRMRAFRPLLGLILSYALIACATTALVLDLGIWGLAVAFGAMALGAWVRVALVTRPRLRKADAAWANGSPASEVLEALPHGGGGELERQVSLLRGRANFALGFRDAAWTAFREADLARIGWPLRAFARLPFRSLPDAPSSFRVRAVRGLLRLAPHSARLHHLLGLIHLRRQEPDLAWAQFEAALPHAFEDTLLLEDLMRAGFSLGREALGERALSQLMARHGDPRLPWDRPAALHFLLSKGRMLDALALARPVPAELRGNPLHWIGEAIPLKALGNLEAAWGSLDAGLKRLPNAFPLWMERSKLALELQKDDEALAALGKAEQCLPEGAEDLRQEWALRRAEAAWWIEGDAETAWTLLADLPDTVQGDQHPPLRLQLLTALGRHEEAMASVKTLLKSRPKDPALLLLQADCMAGMEAWGDLLPFLDTLPLRAREQAAYWHLRGLALAHLNDHLGARMELERAARMDPSRIRHLLDAGHACAELGEWARAEAHWRQALELESDSEEALIQLSDARRELHDMEGSRRYLRECLVHYPDSADAQDRLAELETN
ncbi:MAG: hypothetical protein JST24_06935 [Acidobacteria bacterium]|nr:hypothetical protein [Acidobacteriota bacterium]